MKIKSVRCERMWTRAYVDIHTRARMCLHVCACMRVVCSRDFMNIYSMLNCVYLLWIRIFCLLEFYKNAYSLQTEVYKNYRFQIRKNVVFHWFIVQWEHDWYSLQILHTVFFNYCMLSVISVNYYPSYWVSHSNILDVDLKTMISDFENPPTLIFVQFDKKIAQISSFFVIKYVVVEDPKLHKIMHNINIYIFFIL